MLWFQFSQEIDPCDPTVARNAGAQQAKFQHRGEGKAQGRSKAGKGKGKGRKIVDEERAAKPVRKLWYEAVSPEGYTYYWHVETNGTFFSSSCHPFQLFATFRQYPRLPTTREISLEFLKQRSPNHQSRCLSLDCRFFYLFVYSFVRSRTGRRPFLYTELHTRNRI